MTKENIYWVSPASWENIPEAPLIFLKISKEGLVLVRIRDPENDFKVGLRYDFQVAKAVIGEHDLIKRIFSGKITV
jgi:hypothetical protein